MKFGSFLVTVAVALGTLVATQGCLGGSNDATSEDKLCVPGNFVFCRCADRTPGTKLCKSDAKSFDACTTSDSGECVGGEIPDENTNQPLPPGTKPDPLPPSGNAIDACPGKPQAVAPGIDIKIEGDTTTATGDRSGREGACKVGAGGKDHVYRLIASGSGSLDVKVQGSDGLDPVIYMRSTCDDEASQTSCGPTTANKLAQFKLNVLTGKEYFLFIDGASGSTGKYVATLKLTTGPFCGDGKVDPGEACDDINKVDDDGCANDCRRVNGNPTSGGSCPGQSVDVWSGQTVTGTGSTNSYGNAWTTPASSACGVDVDGTNNYQDHIYGVTPHSSGTLEVKITAPAVGTLANHMISARRSCATIGTETKLCSNAASAGSPETLTLSVTANQKVFIAVDGGGLTNNKGDYNISFKLL